MIGQDRRQLIDVFTQPADHGAVNRVLNRFYDPQADPPKGLQINYEDPANPIVGYTVDGDVS